MEQTNGADEVRADQRVRLMVTTVAILIGAFVSYAILAGLSAREGSGFDASLPNPMGGPAQAAPGEASGGAVIAGLRVDGVEIAMGDVGLGITYVPAWEVVNPTDGDLTVRAGQPQVIDGCCPGPIYADGELTQMGQPLRVPAGGSVLLQFPLQMHPGMDGPHHLAIPLVSGDEDTALHVTGNFTASAPSA